MSFEFNYKGRTFTLNDDDTKRIEETPWVACYMQYHSEDTRCFRSTEDAIGSLYWQLGNGWAWPIAVVNATTHEVAWQEDMGLSIFDTYE